MAYIKVNVNEGRYVIILIGWMKINLTRYRYQIVIIIYYYHKNTDNDTHQTSNILYAINVYQVNHKSNLDLITTNDL